MRKSPTIISRKGFLVVFHLKCPRVAPFLGERIDGPGEKVLNSRSFSMILPVLVRIMRNLPLLQNLSPRAHPSLIQSPDNHSCPHFSSRHFTSKKKEPGFEIAPCFIVINLRHFPVISGRWAVTLVFFLCAPMTSFSDSLRMGALNKKTSLEYQLSDISTEKNRIFGISS